MSNQQPQTLDPQLILPALEAAETLLNGITAGLSEDEIRAGDTGTMTLRLVVAALDRIREAIEAAGGQPTGPLDRGSAHDPTMITATADTLLDMVKDLREAVTRLDSLADQLEAKRR